MIGEHVCKSSWTIARLTMAYKQAYVMGTAVSDSSEREARELDSLTVLEKPRLGRGDRNPYSLPERPVCRTSVVNFRLASRGASCNIHASTLLQVNMAVGSKAHLSKTACQCVILLGEGLLLGWLAKGTSLFPMP